MWDIFKSIESLLGLDDTDEITVKKNSPKVEVKKDDEKKTNTPIKTETTTKTHSSSNTTKTTSNTTKSTTGSTTNTTTSNTSSNKTTSNSGNEYKSVDEIIWESQPIIIRMSERESNSTKEKGLKATTETFEEAKDAVLNEMEENNDIIEEEAEKKIEKVSVNLINKIKEKFGLAAARDVVRDEASLFIPKGIATGLEKNSEEALCAFEELFSSIEHQRALDIINDEEYYNALESLRDEFLVKGSDEWLHYTGIIYDYQKDLLEKEKKRYEETYDEIFEYTSDKIDAVIKKQSEYQDKLQSYGRIFQKNTILLDDEEDIEFYSLGDLKKQNAELERYVNLMVEAKKFIKDSGLSDDAVDELLKDISSLPVHSASTALEALMRSPHSKSWLLEYEKRVTLSKAGSDLYFKDEYEEAIDESTDYMKEKLSEAGYEIPESFFDAGKDAAAKFGEGFSVELSTELEKIKTMIGLFSSNIDVTLTNDAGKDIAKAGDEINTTNYYINAASNEDVTNTIKRYETIKRLGGY